jgi:hypothetical protein
MCGRGARLRLRGAGIVPAPLFLDSSDAMTNLVKFPASREMKFAWWLSRRGYRAASRALARGNVARAVQLVPKHKRRLARALAEEVLAGRQLRGETRRCSVWRNTRRLAQKTRELERFIFEARVLLARS